VRKALTEILTRMSHAGSSEANFVNDVSNRLKGWIAEGCPALSESEGAKLSAFLSERIRGLLHIEGGGGLFASVSPAVLERIVGRFESWAVAGEALRSSKGRELIEAYRLGNSINEIKRNLFTLEVGANGNAEEFRQVSNRLEELKEGIAKQNQLKGQAIARRSEAVNEEKRWEMEVKRLEESQDQVSQAAQDSRFVLKAVKALNEISERIKTLTRADLETMLNDRFKRIIQHPLIDRIGIDEGYVLTFFDETGKPIGRTSLSSGMKQLAATALLWAMKDSANIDVPVIIDTPLGRIDRENQEHLLRAYYPVLSRQVIILPTNAEIDERKLKLLSDKVATHFRILNTSGDAATVEEGSLV
jgi:DNA sulfur modification protein DndD